MQALQSVPPSTNNHFREVGATLGVAVFGTVCTNRMVARGEAVAGDDDVREATPPG